MAGNNGNTYIEYEQAKMASETIQGCRNTMQMIFDDTEATMIRATDPTSTEGQVGVALKNQFDSLKSTYAEYTRKVDQLKEILDANIAATEQTEHKEAARAEELAGK